MDSVHSEYGSGAELPTRPLQPSSDRLPSPRALGAPAQARDVRSQSVKETPIPRPKPLEYATADWITGRFQVRSLLGQGGMGQVYLVWDVEAAEERALKVFSQELPESSSNHDLASEFLALCQFRHPHIVSVYDFGHADDGRAFFTMEYVPGQTLTSYCGESIDGQVQVLVMDVLLALSSIHGQGMLHADLKPGNIMIMATPEGRDIAKLADFGLAAAMEGFHYGTLCGTVPYMAPELLRREAIDQRADLYSLGVVLYELWTGRRPFRADSLQELVQCQLHEAPLPPSTWSPHIPPVWEEVIMRLLEKKPGLRYNSAEEVALALGGRGFGEASSPPPSFHIQQSIGRERETSRFMARLKQLPLAGGWMFLSGPAGTGKSHLLSDWRVQTQVEGGSQWLQLVPSPDLPFSPLPELFRLMASRHPTLSSCAAIADALTGRSGDLRVSALSSPSEHRIGLFASIAQELQACSCEEPMVLVLEQWERASEDAQALLHFLIRALPKQPFLWIISGRDQRWASEASVVPTSHVECLALSLFGEPEVRHLLRAALGSIEEESALVHYLLRESGGFPLLITERLQELLESKLLRSIRGKWWFDPISLDDARTKTNVREEQGTPTDVLSPFMWKKIEACSPIERGMLELLALLGRAVTEGLLLALSEKLSGLGEGPFSWPGSADLIAHRRACEALLDKGLLRELPGTSERTFCLSPSHIEGMIKARLSQSERGALWAGCLYRSLLALRQEGVAVSAACLARYALSAGATEVAGQLLLEAAEAFKSSRAFAQGYAFFVELAEVMLQQEATLQAVQALEQAAHLAEHLGQHDAVKHHLMTALALLEGESAIEMIRAVRVRGEEFLKSSQDGAPLTPSRRPCDVAAVTGDVAQQKLLWRARLFRQVGHVHDKESAFVEAITWFERALALLVPHHSESISTERLKLKRSMGWSLMKLGRYDEAREIVEQALADADRGGDHIARCQLYRLCAGIAFYQGDARQVEAAAQAALDLALVTQDARGEAEAYFTFGNFANLKGDYEEAVFSFTKAFEAFEKLGLLDAMGRCMNNLGVASYQQGRWGDAIHYWECFATICERLGDRIALVNALNNFGFLYKDQGAFQQARQTIDQALSISLKEGLEQFEATLRGNLGEILWRIGELDAARKQLARAEQKATERRAEHEVLESRRRLLAIDLDEGLYESVQAQLPGLLRLAGMKGYKSEEGQLLKLEGALALRLHQPSRAMDALQRANKLFSSLKARYEQAQCWYLMAEAAVGLGQCEMAIEYNKLAKERFHTLGASWDLKQMLG